MNCFCSSFFPVTRTFSALITITKSPVSHMRSVNGLFLAAQQIGGLHCHATQDLVCGVDDPPLAWHFVGFGGKGLHCILGKRAGKLGGGFWSVNGFVPSILRRQTAGLSARSASCTEAPQAPSAGAPDLDMVDQGEIAQTVPGDGDGDGEPRHLIAVLVAGRNERAQRFNGSFAVEALGEVAAERGEAVIGAELGDLCAIDLPAPVPRARRGCLMKP